MLFLISALIIFLVSLFTFFPSFSLGLFGDDWVMLWMYMHYFGPQATPGVTNHFSFFLSGYGPYEITMGLINKFFGLESSVYYLFSYTFRLLAAFAVWPLIFYLTRSRLAAFYGSLFLSITYIGLETTNWVFNMTSYLAAAFLSIFLYFYIRSREELKTKMFVLSIICFYLSYIFAPIRMTGLLPFTILLEIFLYFRSPNLKLSFFRLISAFIVFIIITTTGAVTETQGRLIDGAMGIITSGIQTSFSLIKEGQFMFLLNPVITIGEMIIPDVYFKNIPKPNNLFTLLGLLILTISFVLFKRTKDSRLRLSFFVSIAWITCSFIFSWFRDPIVLHPTDFRYFAPTTVGFAIFLGSIIGFGKNIKIKTNIFLIMLPVIVLHLITSRNYLNKAIDIHGAEAVNKMWASFPPINEFYKYDQPLVFYFRSTSEKRFLLYYGVQFGLPYRISFFNKMFDKQDYFKMPVPLGETEWPDVVSAVTDGKSLVSRGHPQKPIPITNIYSFFLDENNNLNNITEKTRTKLEEELEVK